MTDKQPLTHERLLEQMQYDPLTGVMRRRACRYASAVGAPAGSLSGGYLRASIDGVSYYVHRLAWFYVAGVWPSRQLDHKNFDRTDNRIANLREVSAKQNIEHRHKPCTNTSGFKGVSLDRTKWRAQIYQHGKPVFLGLFMDKAEAYATYTAGAARLHTHNPAAAAA